MTAYNANVGVVYAKTHQRSGDAFALKLIVALGVKLLNFRGFNLGVRTDGYLNQGLPEGVNVGCVAIRTAVNLDINRDAVGETRHTYQPSGSLCMILVQGGNTSLMKTLCRQMLHHA